MGATSTKIEIDGCWWTPKGPRLNDVLIRHGCFILKREAKHHYIRNIETILDEYIYEKNYYEVGQRILRMIKNGEMRKIIYGPIPYNAYEICSNWARGDPPIHNKNKQYNREYNEGTFEQDGPTIYYQSHTSKNTTNSDYTDKMCQEYYDSHPNDRAIVNAYNAGKGNPKRW